ncbi:MAG: branched-chain amino acid transport system II carrier protein [Parachlamydiaceae bacterium]|nr:branched-chain amino acid transport system II carrier protein [Parachlamydiaceae bacterium]
MKQSWLIISLGFALFSMFFGGGNLVFPILLGQESGDNYLMGALGITLTSVAVPFMGVFGMLLYGGNLNAFFNTFGRHGTFIFSLIGLSLLGPFGVVARCLTVSHGALTLLYTDLSLPISSVVLCTIIFFLAINKNQIIKLLGTFLSPFLLISLAAIAIFGLWQGETPQPNYTDQWDVLKNGIFQGYQTMDLLAGFFFSQFVINHLRNHLTEIGQEKKMFQIFSKASLFGMGLLGTIYFVLVTLGASYAPILEGKPPQEMLGIIAFQCLGRFAAPCVCLAIVFACTTTAIVLSSFFAEFVNMEITKGKLGNTLSLLITMGIAYGISTLDFNGIAEILGPIVELIYPALIAITILKIGLKVKKLNPGLTC